MAGPCFDAVHRYFGGIPADRQDVVQVFCTSVTDIICSHVVIGNNGHDGGDFGAAHRADSDSRGIFLIGRVEAVKGIAVEAAA